MSIRIYTTQPKSLLSAIKSAIDERHVVTWSYDRDGDFTHNVDQWRNQAWLRPRTETDHHLLTTIAQTGTRLSKEAYGVYHGRFAEMMLAHFDKNFSGIVLSALAKDGDRT